MPEESSIDPLRTIVRANAPAPSTIDRTGQYQSGSTTASSGRIPQAHKSSWPSIPGYEILQELGRGGMGVVYLARQSSLKRLVALKMIRGGADASTEQLERFKVEAEAVARLQHPNIVQIFEVSEHEGNPFFALEYVEGGSMAAALAAGAWTPTEAAELVETLTRALHHAHQKSIVHRDLKPANVLLSPDRVPKVTDFGLAKRLEDGDSGHTRTGAVMGTPSYMAPEQASGRIHQIGPATDVYALGTILYECLTGQVPFKSDSVLDTLEMVRSADPKPPSLIRPGVPRDLETICLKAMSKAPEARYSSALAMAQDLERFRAGEPILGRRAGTIQKFVRQVRRNKALVTAALAVLVAIGTISIALLSNRSSRELRTVEERVAQDLEHSTWDAASGDAVEKDIARLTALDANRGEVAHQKLIERFAASIQSDLKKPRVLDSEVPGLESRLAWLTSRDAGLARNLEGDLRARLRTWQPIVDLAAPFAGAMDQFPPNAVRMEADRLISTQHVIATRIPSLGTIKVAVDFDGEWYKSAQIGMLLGCRPDGPQDQTNGYSFVLRPAWSRSDPDAAPRSGTPASFEVSDGSAALEILRDGAQLGVAPVQVRTGPIRLTAERDGDRLAIQLDGAAAVPFEDPVPLPSVASSTLAILWPPGTAIRRLRVDGQVISSAASRLERADDLYGRGKPIDALAMYETFALEASDPAVKAEARYKAGLCLVQLDRGSDAAKLFEEVTTGTSPRWGVIAAFQLWLLKLKAKQFEDAEAALAVIKIRFPKETIARYVPVSIRTDIDAQFVIPTINLLVFDPKMIPQLEAAIQLAEVLQLKSGGAEQQALALVVAYALAGEYRKARTIADKYLEAILDQGHSSGGRESPHWIARWHAWMSRLDGQTTGYNEQIAKHLGRPLREGESAEERKRAFIPLRLENARNSAAAGKWDAVENELAAYLAEYPPPFDNYAFYSQAYFMKGFARLKANDTAGAEAAWKTGTYSQYVKGFPPESRPASALPPSRKALAENWAMAALSNTLTDEDALKIVETLMTSFGAEAVTTQVAAALNLSPAVVRGVWTSPRGRECARRMAFLDLTPNEYFWTAPRLIVYEKLRQELLGGTPTPEQDEVLWTASLKTCEAFRTGELSKSQLFQLALAWKGTTNLLGWGGLSSKLKPELRGPAAYVLGLRYLKLNKPTEAAGMFKTAAADAPISSPLKKLAEAELAKRK